MPLTLYRRGAIWHYRGTVAGRRLRGSCKTTDKTIAQRIASDKEGREWRRHLDGPEAVLTFANAATAYRKAGKPTRFLARLEDLWKNTLVKNINPGRIRQSSIDLFPDASGAYRNRAVISPTAAIINLAAEQGFCQRVRVKKWPVEHHEKTPATWDWVEAFRAVASPQLGALALFMFCTGARISEALAVTWDDVDFSRRNVLIRQTKIGAERLAHMQPELLASIASLQDRDGPVFGYRTRDHARLYWDRAVREAGIKRLSFHACRHGFATAMLQAGVDPVTTAKRGGWKSVQHVFATYGHASDDVAVTDRIVPVTVTTKARKA